MPEELFPTSGSATGTAIGPSAGLLERHRAGRTHRLRLVAGPLRDAAAWIEDYRRFWESQFDALDRHLEATRPPGEGQ